MASPGCATCCPPLSSIQGFGALPMQSTNLHRLSIYSGVRLGLLHLSWQDFLRQLHGYLLTLYLSRRYSCPTRDRGERDGALSNSGHRTLVPFRPDMPWMTTWRRASALTWIHFCPPPTFNLYLYPLYADLFRHDPKPPTLGGREPRLGRS